MAGLIPDDILAILDDPYQTISRFKIEHREAKIVRLEPNLWTPEQVMLVGDWWDSKAGGLRDSCRETTVVKGRNQGVGLITQAFFAWYVARCVDPVHVILAAQTEATRDKHILRYKQLIRSLPSILHPTATKDNDALWAWDDGKEFRGVTMGGQTGAAQGFTAHMLHVTEGGPMKGEVAEVQRKIASVDATMHVASPHYFKVYESTSEGPSGWWPTHVANVRRNIQAGGFGVNFRFFPWSVNPSFRVPFRSQAALHSFMDSVTPREALVVQQHAAYMADLAKNKPANFRWIQNNYPALVTMTPEALHWRRTKMEGAFGNDEIMFAHDYPMTVEEAFLSSGIGWFDVAYLTEMLNRVESGRRTPDGGMVWLEPSPSHRYVVGVDIAEGLGGDTDNSVIQVLDSELRQCFVWASNREAPDVVGELAVRVAATYNNALLLIEANKRGAEALKAARKLGYKNFYLEKRASGKMDDFVTSGNQFASKKEMLYGHARTQVAKRRVTLNDRLTIDELMSIGVDARGSINGRDGKHDDRAMAWVLAVWAAQRLSLAAERSGMARIMDDYGLHDAGSRRTIPFG